VLLCYRVVLQYIFLCCNVTLPFRPRTMGAVCCDVLDCVVAACVAVMLCGVACSACCSVSHIMLEALRKAACLISVLFI